MIQEAKGSSEPLYSQHPESQAIVMDLPVTIIDGSNRTAGNLRIEPNVDQGQPLPRPIPARPDVWGQPNTRYLLRALNPDGTPGAVLFQDEGGYVEAGYTVGATARGHLMQGGAGHGRESDRDYAFDFDVVDGQMIFRLGRAITPGVRGANNVMAWVKQ